MSRPTKTWWDLFIDCCLSELKIKLGKVFEVFVSTAMNAKRPIHFNRAIQWDTTTDYSHFPKLYCFRLYHYGKFQKWQVEANKKRRKVDNICELVISQTKKIDGLLKENSGSPQWMIMDSCRKLKQLLDTREALSMELVNICNNINENLQLAIITTSDQ